MNLSGRERTLFAAAASVAILCVLYVSAIEPAFKTWKHDGVLLTERNQRIAAMERELSKEPEISARYTAAMKAVADAQKSAMTSRKLFAQLQTLAASADVKIKGASPLPPAKHEYFDEISLRIDVSSKLPGLVLFLDSIKRQEGLSVTRLNVSPVEPGNPLLTSQIQISATAYNGKAASL